MKLFVRALVGAVSLAMLSGGAAHATAGSPPVTVDDHVTMTAFSESEPDVLANDSDPDGDKLAVCRLGKIPSGIDVEMISGRLMLFGFEPGTYSFTYYACDYEFLTPGTVTVTVKAPPPVYVKVFKGPRPGRVWITNNGRFGLDFQWGSYRNPKADGRVRVPAHSSVRVRVRRPSLIWVAANVRKAAFKVGTLRGIKLPAGVDALPPGAPPVGASFPRTTWLLKR